jgi:hypothetical protein
VAQNSVWQVAIAADILTHRIHLDHFTKLWRNATEQEKRATAVEVNWWLLWQKLEVREMVTPSDLACRGGVFRGCTAPGVALKCLPMASELQGSARTAVVFLCRLRATTSGFAAWPPVIVDMSRVKGGVCPMADRQARMIPVPPLEPRRRTHSTCVLLAVFRAGERWSTFTHRTPSSAQGREPGRSMTSSGMTKRSDGINRLQRGMGRWRQRLAVTRRKQ